jgi:hypothetical protein
MNGGIILDEKFERWRHTSGFFSDRREFVDGG